MSHDVDEFFKNFDDIADSNLTNDQLQNLVPMVERICTDYEKRNVFFDRFDGINDRRRKMKVVDAFHFAVARYTEYEQGVLDEGEFQRTIGAQGGLALIVGGILAVVTGMLPAVGLLLILGVVGIAAAALGMWLSSMQKRRRAKAVIEDIRSFTAQLQAAL